MVVIATKTDADDGPPSDEVTGTPGTTVQVMPPGRVTGVAVTPEVGELSVSWTRVTDATGYIVQWISGGETFNSPNEHVITEGGTTSYTIPNLMGGTEYTVRVIATKSGADE